MISISPVIYVDMTKKSVLKNRGFSGVYFIRNRAQSDKKNSSAPMYERMCHIPNVFVISTSAKMFVKELQIRYKNSGIIIILVAFFLDAKMTAPDTAMYKSATGMIKAMGTPEKSALTAKLIMKRMWPTKNAAPPIMNHLSFDGLIKISPSQHANRAPIKRKSGLGNPLKRTYIQSESMRKGLEIFENLSSPFHAPIRLKTVATIKTPRNR